MSAKLGSFLFPHILKKGHTPKGQYYEVSFENGRKVLNTQNANYSFGSLHDVMQKGIKHLLKTNFNFEKILMLGLGAGSAVQILNKNIQHQFTIDCIEYDQGIIDIAKQEFDIEDHKNLNIICGDAQNISTISYGQKYDLIIDDIFVDDNIPSFCFQANYIQNCAQCLNEKGTYLRNMMFESIEKLSQFEIELSKHFGTIEILKVKKHGNLIFICTV